MAFYIFAHFDPRPGKEAELREELEQVLEPTRAEPGCVRINLYASVREPVTWFIHSEWVDEAAFDAHVGLPHTVRFGDAVEKLIAHPLRAVRTEMVA